LLSEGGIFLRQGAQIGFIEFIDNNIAIIDLIDVVTQTGIATKLGFEFREVLENRIGYWLQNEWLVIWVTIILIISSFYPGHFRRRMVLDLHSEAHIEFGISGMVAKDSLYSVLTAISANVCGEHPRQLEKWGLATEDHGDKVAEVKTSGEAARWQATR
jgi:hypothetical protein